MNTNPFRPLALATLLLVSGSSGWAQAASAAPKIDFPAASPTATVKQRVGLTDIEIVYSRPSTKGRQMIGSIDPYGKLWRTGANASTKITFSTPVQVSGVKVPAGTYAMFTIPDKKEWTFILNRASKTNLADYQASEDVVRVKIKPTTLSQPVETFTIDLNDLRTESATLNLLWEKTRVAVPLQFEVKSALVAQIQAAMSAAQKPTAGVYYSAASFYFDQGLDLNQAKTWINQATEGEAPYFMVHLKAKILAKLGDKAGALAAAKKSNELAGSPDGPNRSIVNQNHALIASLR